MTIENLNKLLNMSVFSIGGQSISLGSILLMPVIVILGIIITRLIVRMLTKRMLSNKVDPNVIHLIQRVFYVIATAVLVITLLDLMNVPIAAFAFLSGAIAIGFGFGAQNIINNFISGWILMWEKPIRIGDFLEVENAKGTVEEINTRSTRIRRSDGVHMLIPNSKLLENTVVNWTLVDRLMRTSVRVGVAYGSPAKKVAELILQATLSQTDVLTDPKPVVTLDNFGDSALEFEVYFWISSHVEGGLRVTRSNVRFRIEELFAEQNIVIAFPQRDVNVKGSLSINNTN
ncbi:mechanosensitive ion channel family protein [Thalassotalea piscium]|uniref:Small-conductance mechanosensitive channel n=1 Tax=Thalassotalea piscium TaxID=1230533 RepID=A0A7X0TU88_9GAMM|nr:mechanosensitive ion channel domain-containing protein [Thalassotalea piscium]MBB6543943.1 small-conductance mechanosensitive channel [Thalassotalea piscium]